RSGERGVVVPVARLDVPAERAELRGEVAEREDLLRLFVRLELVAVDDRPEIPDALVRGSGERLPVLPLLQLAVARHHDDPAAAAEEPLGTGRSASLRETHARGAGVRLDPGHADVGMAVEAAEPPELQQPF